MRRVREITVVILGTEQDVENLISVVEKTLCPEPDHPGPCPIPWSITTMDPDSRSPKEEEELRRELDPIPDSWE